MKRLACWLACALPTTLAAAPFDFIAAISVSGARTPGVYHHLDGPGRQHVAVSREAVAVVWEDNRDGSAQAYFASKQASARQFQTAQKVSTGKSASEPVVAALGGDRFLVGWEQDGSAWVRRVESGVLGPPRRLASGAAHVALAARDGLVYAAWSEQQTNFLRLRLARLSLAAETRVDVTNTVDVEPGTVAGDQQYPSLALLKHGGVVAWEDRRRGHTAIYYSSFDDQQGLRASRLLNELRSRRSVNFGRGPGAARVALAVCGETCVMALWMDKRNFLSGYDVYAAPSNDAGHTFGKNEKVQDEFGSNISQWHGAIAAGKGQVIAVWDDDRDETADIWISWREPGGWSADEAVPPASGAGIQSSPVIAVDAGGNLHLIWLDRQTDDGPTQIRYSMGRNTAAVNPP